MVRGQRRGRAEGKKLRARESPRITSYFSEETCKSGGGGGGGDPRPADALPGSSPHRIEMRGGRQVKVTDYFPVRRSLRKSTKTVLEEMQKGLEEAVQSDREDGLRVRVFDGKGRGVVATTAFNRGDFVVEYAGELISGEEARRREAEYARDEKTGCYMYYFHHGGGSWCVDATAESSRLGRLVNHSRSGNLMTKVVAVRGEPRLVLVAKTAVAPGDELTYDYGDRSKDSLRHHPWLAL